MSHGAVFVFGYTFKSDKQDRYFDQFKTMMEKVFKFNELDKMSVDDELPNDSEMPIDTELDEFGDSLAIPATNELKFHATQVKNQASHAIKLSQIKLSNLNESDEKKEQKQIINSSSSSTDSEE